MRNVNKEERRLALKAAVDLGTITKMSHRDGLDKFWLREVKYSGTGRVHDNHWSKNRRLGEYVDLTVETRVNRGVSCDCFGKTAVPARRA